MQTTIDPKQIRDGGSLSVGDNLNLRFRTERDECHGAPWEECDGHGPVSEWTRRDKLPGERELCADRSSRRFYDYASAIALAKRDGWGLSAESLAKLTAKLGRKPTAGQVREAAVGADFEFLRGWCADEWQYVTVFVSLVDGDGEELASDCLGGVESFGDYWREQAADMANELLRAHAAETAERESWACRDTVTKGGRLTLAFN